MEGVGWIGAIVIGIIAGWIAEKVTARSHGLFMNLAVGLVGSLVGAFIAHLAGFTYTGFWPSLVVSAIGAIVLLFIVGLFQSRSASYR
jgi:uncharacterized membrane protein YeaQ/YmgE (transglycosylase-associated protein family)